MIDGGELFPLVVGKHRLKLGRGDAVADRPHGAVQLSGDSLRGPAEEQQTGDQLPVGLVTQAHRTRRQLTSFQCHSVRLLSGEKVVRSDGTWTGTCLTPLVLLTYATDGDCRSCLSRATGSGRRRAQMGICYRRLSVSPLLACSVREMGVV